MRLAFARSLALCAALLAAWMPRAGAQNASEAEVKAAYLYKFPAFVEWPQQRAGPFVIAVAGADEVADELAKLTEGRSVHGRPIQVRTLAPGESAAAAQMLFVGRNGPRLPALTKGLAGTPVLVVSEIPDALDQGSMINFVVVDGRVRFEVSLETTGRAQLRVSPRLLAVAMSVRSSRP